MGDRRTRVKMCGLRRPEDIDAVNELKPEYIGFVFASGSRRYIAPREAAELRKRLDPGIRAVGVFTDAAPEKVARLLEEGVIDLAQLHGHEDAAYLAALRKITGKPLIQAFRIREAADARRAEASGADAVLLDAGAGDGKTFDWDLVKGIRRPYFLAGGLTPENAGQAVRELKPFAVDVSSGIETDGIKDAARMRAFMRAVRGNDKA